MAPPLITPSPHRFVTSKPNPTPKPSSLRFQQQAPQPASSQFAPAPRFNFSSTQKYAADNATPATQYSSPLSRRPYPPAAISRKDREDIEEASPGERDDDEDEDEEHEAPSRFAPPTQPTSKRRRPNPPSESMTIFSDPPSPSTPPSTPPLPITEHEETFEIHSYAHTPAPRQAPRFVLPSPAQETPSTHPHSQTPASHPAPRFVLPSPLPSTTNPTIPNRPPLILPPRSPSPPLEVPLFFSPHRKGQKYIPGGLASTVRDWIIETAQVGHTHSHARKGGLETWDVKFVVEECRSEGIGAGMVLVRVRGEERGWVLAGKGRGDGVVGVGKVVGVTEPVWEVDIQGEVWRVGVEWKVLDG